ncbi:TetR/AcrR family transcriptional regulator [Thalassospira marina]|uniref:TetR family transcriptional regulator n=1 Tax=Thalassospira marina TaxID=2048283 RepID=A0A2N3KWU1_9PROT|nr:TetR/AcrR family transcriptional regulator [Thalassospira marina]PKR54956.1 TetR family transcriptional regulator [Thalassospira marina]
MDNRSKIISAAEKLFDTHGFMATGMDRLTAAADMSSRTLYKHAGSKAALMAAVLAAREQRFMEYASVDSVDALFVALHDWLETEGSRGCLFLRALGETGGDIPEIAAVVAAHKERFGERVRAIVAQDLGHDDANLADQILVLFEGATATAVYRGSDAVAAARRAAGALMGLARS